MFGRCRGSGESWFAGRKGFASLGCLGSWERALHAEALSTDSMVGAYFGLLVSLLVSFMEGK